MGALEAAPAGVLMPRGCDDIAGPPHGASPARQPEWLRRHAPADYAPPPLLASLALESGRREGQAPAACITGARLGNDYVILSAAGPARDLIALSALPAAPGAVSSAALDLESLQAVGHSPWYARAAAPLLQLSLSGAAPGGWAANQPLPNAPLLAARSAGAVEFWQLEQHQEKELVWRLGPQLGAARSAAAAGGPAGELADVAWGRHLAQRCAVLRRDGSVLEVTLSPSGAATSLAWAPDAALTASLPFLDPSATGMVSTSSFSPTLRCAFPSCHPRQLLVSLHSTVGLVDLRGGGGRRGGMLSVFSCAQGEWISALAAAPDPEAPPPSPFLAAAATPSAVLVFDLRRPQVPLVEWEHGMEAEGKAKSARALRFAPPDALQWLPAASGPSGERRLLASCSWSGRGVVCEWEERRGRGGVAVGPGGQLRETALREGQVESDSFFLEPAWWTQAEARRTPQLLYDLRIGYPRALGDAAGEAAAAQRRRAASRAMRAGDGGGEDRKQSRVMMLPAAHHGRELLGVTALSPAVQWAGNSGNGSGSSTAVNDGDFLLAMLSPTQEVLLATVRPRQPAASAAAPPPPPPPMVLPAPLEPEEAEESGEGEVAFVEGKAQVLMDPQVELAAAAAAGAALPGAEAGGPPYPPNGPSQPRIRIKKAPLVDLPLHRWLLEEAIRQHGMTPGQHSAEFGGAELLRAQAAAEGLSDITAAAQVAITAQEAWQALAASSPHAQSAFEGHVPSITGPGRRRKGAERGEGGSAAEALDAALTHGGLLPLDLGQRAVPVDGSEPLVAQNPALSFFPGPSFPQALAAAVAAAAAAPLDPGQASTSAPPRSHVPSPLHLRRAGASPPAAAARSGVPTPWGVPLTAPGPSATAAGSELVYAPPIRSTNEGPAGLARGVKAPSAEASAALEQLRAAWGGGG